MYFLNYGILLFVKRNGFWILLYAYITYRCTIIYFTKEDNFYCLPWIFFFFYMHKTFCAILTKIKNIVSWTSIALFKDVNYVELCKTILNFNWFSSHSFILFYYIFLYTILCVWTKTNHVRLFIYFIEFEIFLIEE